MRTKAYHVTTLPAAILASLLSCTLTASAWALPIDKQLVVTVITVCDDGGGSCASNGPVTNLYYEDETDKIWAQAGIDVKFVSGGTLNSTFLLNNADSLFDFTGSLPGPGTTMYLVNDLDCPACILYGQAFLDNGGLVVNMGAVDGYNVPFGRIDTIAHELGHNLGLPHNDGSGNYLMASGSIRNIPSTLADIFPDGLNRDQLPQLDIDNARDSDLLIDFTPSASIAIPEPSTFSLLSLGAVGLAIRARRRRVAA